MCKDPPNLGRFIRHSFWVKNAPTLNIYHLQLNCSSRAEQIKYICTYTAALCFTTRHTLYFCMNDAEFQTGFVFWFASKPSRVAKAINYELYRYLQMDWYFVNKSELID